MRQGECFGLTIDRVDFDRALIVIHRQLVQLSGELPHIAPPETPASHRTIPMRRAVADAIATRFHELRHYYASALIEAGESVKVIQSRLGHKSARGLDLSRLRRRGRPAMGRSAASSLPVRLDPDLRRALDERAAAEYTTVSHVVREALRQHLNLGTTGKEAGAKHK